MLLGEEAIGMVGWPEVQASIAYLPDFAIGRQLREGVRLTLGRADRCCRALLVAAG